MAKEKCPNCRTVIRLELTKHGPINMLEEGIWNPEWVRVDYIEYGICPECNESIIYLLEADKSIVKEGVEKEIKRILIFPPVMDRETVTPDFVPEDYYKDYIEAIQILPFSPKSSATLTRRILQHILRDTFGINKNSLSQEIDAFIAIPGIPTSLTTAIDAVRTIGNYAAHPTKNKVTGEIVEVEPGEAEWLIEIIEYLFEFTFIQPKKLEERLNKLNKKLKEADKPPVKGRK